MQVAPLLAQPCTDIWNRMENELGAASDHTEMFRFARDRCRRFGRPRSSGSATAAPKDPRQAFRIRSPRAGIITANRGPHRLPGFPRTRS
jgi:hypothetical protein